MNKNKVNSFFDLPWIHQSCSEMAHRVTDAGSQIFINVNNIFC